MPYEISTHASLLEKLRSPKDDGAWREFHDRYCTLIRDFARHRGLQPVDSDDIVQEVLMEVHRGIRDFRYDRDKGRFRGFLKTITLRKIWKKQRRAAAVDESALAALGHDPEVDAVWEAQWRQYHLRLAMARIKLEYAATDVQIFEMLTAEGRPPGDVAEESGEPVEAIYRIKSRILKRLKELIAEQVEAEG